MADTRFLVALRRVLNVLQENISIQRVAFYQQAVPTVCQESMLPLGQKRARHAKRGSISRFLLKQLA